MRVLCAFGASELRAQLLKSRELLSQAPLARSRRGLRACRSVGLREIPTFYQPTHESRAIRHFDFDEAEYRLALESLLDAETGNAAEASPRSRTSAFGRLRARVSAVAEALEAAPLAGLDESIVEELQETVDRSWQALLNDAAWERLLESAVPMAEPAPSTPPPSLSEQADPLRASIFDT